MKMHNQQLLTVLLLGASAAHVAMPAEALDLNDLTFTGLMLPTDAANGAGIVVGVDASLAFGGAALSFNDTYIYDVPNNTFNATGLIEFGGPGSYPEVSADGSRISGTIKSPDFGGDPGTSFDGPFDTAGVWTQTLGQSVGTGTVVDLLAIDSPLDSEAYKNYVLEVDPPSSFDRNLGSGYGISGDGNTVVGNYYRKGTAGDNGGMPASYDIAAGTTTAINPGTTPDDDRGQVLGADFDGDVLVGFVDNPFIPTVWVSGVQTELTHPEGTTGRAIAVSDSGDTVAGFQRVVMPDTAVNTQGQVVWHYIPGNDTWRRTTIGRLPGQTEGLAEATGISADGKIVVGYDDAKTLIQGGGIAGSGDNGQGTFWTRHTGLVNIEEFLEARGLDLAGIEIASLQGISPDGETLLAWGFVGGATLNEMSGILIDVSSAPLDIQPTQAVLDTATANLGTAADYVGDTYSGDWDQDGLVTQADLNKLGYLINGGIGDTDFDGDIDDSDLGTAFANYSGPGDFVKYLEDGDTDGDGDVDDSDLGTAFANYTGPLTPTAAVPEPASLTLLSLAGLLITRRRRSA